MQNLEIIFPAVITNSFVALCVCVRPRAIYEMHKCCRKQNVLLYVRCMFGTYVIMRRVGLHTDCGSSVFICLALDFRQYQTTSGCLISKVCI